MNRREFRSGFRCERPMLNQGITAFAAPSVNIEVSIDASKLDEPITHLIFSEYMEPATTPIASAKRLMRGRRTLTKCRRSKRKISNSSSTNGAAVSAHRMVAAISGGLSNGDAGRNINAFNRSKSRRWSQYRRDRYSRKWQATHARRDGCGAVEQPCQSLRDKPADTCGPAKDGVPRRPIALTRALP